MNIRLADLAIAKKLSDEKGIQKAKNGGGEDCTKDSELTKEGYTFDMWINAKYKLIHKIRAYDETDKTKYTEVGQIYKGGKNLNFFASTHDDSNKSDMKLVMELDTGSLTSKGTFTAASKEDNGYDVKATIEIKPYSGEIKVTKPTGTIDIQTILNELGLN